MMVNVGQEDVIESTVVFNQSSFVANQLDSVNVEIWKPYQVVVADWQKGPVQWGLQWFLARA